MYFKDCSEEISQMLKEPYFCKIETCQYEMVKHVSLCVSSVQFIKTDPN